MTFNKYQVIKGAISYELANFIFNYFLLKRDAVDFLYKNKFDAECCTLPHSYSSSSGCACLSNKQIKYFKELNSTFNDSIFSTKVIEAVNESLKKNGRAIRFR